MAIERLSTQLINQIAAGEVVERPASVVKELVENAIDAGATRIEVRSEGGGRTLICVRDNGEGIARDELALALAPHATSKINSIADLQSVATMGFRGEALASIASVSSLQLTSRQVDDEHAWSINAEGNARSEVEPAAGSSGTTVEIRSLFFNTPARAKFLRTDATEHARISERVHTIAMANPSISFHLQFGPRTVIDLPAAATLDERVYAVLGRDLADELLAVDYDGGAARVRGLAGTPQIATPSGRRQRVFLNGRPISDRTIQHAIREAYRGLIVPGRSPTVALFLEVDPALVDCNVHPAKTEVRFRDSGAIHTAVRRALKATLEEHDLTPRIGFGSGNGPADTGFIEPRNAEDRELATRPFGSGFRTEPPRTTSALHLETMRNELAKSTAVAAPLLGDIDVKRTILQAHAKYVFVEHPDGVLIIDQHALHERALFEDLLERIDHGALESQQQLMPEVIDCEEEAIESLELLAPMLKQIGYDARPIGPRSISISGVPSFLLSRNVAPGGFLLDLLAFGAREGRAETAEALLAEVLDMMACKAAIKAGDRLSETELRGLLERRDSIERSSNCPHGRPTSLVLPIEELDRRFGR